MDFQPFDCDVHPTLASLKVLLPYMDAYWQEQVTVRGIDGLDLATYSPKTPIAGRPDWRDGGKAGEKLATLQGVMDRLNTRGAICNVLYGGQTVFNVYFAAAICRATNLWLASEWLDRDPRLRGSIVVPMQDPELAVEEIERCAPDRRFVQVLMLSSGDAPLGRRQYWPIYRAAAKHGLPVALHAGHAHRFAPTYTGWPSYLVEDHVALSQQIQGQLLSLIYEGVFSQFPTLRIVLMESGVTWLPGFLWRIENTWRALRVEVPWVDRPPPEIIREHVRLTAQPIDAPADAAVVRTILDQIGSDDILLYASDYPHWHFDGDDARPVGFSDALYRKIAVENPLATYPRLQETVQ